jgi:hypothetical protein
MMSGVPISSGWANHLSIHPSLYSSYSHLDHRASVSLRFFNLYTVGRTPWTGDQPVATPLSAHKHRINVTHRHPCLEWDSNPRPQCSNERRRFLSWTARPLWSALHLSTISITTRVAEHDRETDTAKRISTKQVQRYCTYSRCTLDGSGLSTIRV